MNENIDIDTTFVPDDSASHEWTERDAGPKRLRCVRSHMCDYAFQP